MERSRARVQRTRLTPELSVLTRLAAQARVSRGFAGLEAVGGNYGGGAPADTILARSPTRVIEMVNRRVRIVTSTGGTLATTDLSRFFGAVGGGGRPVGPPLFDPKVFYDRNSSAPRYYAVALQGNPNAAQQMSRLYLAVSRGPNPGTVSTADWCRYFVDMRRVIGAVPDTWADYPSLGAGADAIVMSTNQFSWPAGQAAAEFAGSIVMAWSKADLNQNAGGCPAIPAAYEWSADGGAQLLPSTMQVGQHFTNPSSFAGAENPVYLVNSVPVRGSRAYQVWRIANVGAGSPLLWGPVRVVGSFRNDIPPLAPGGAGARIDTGDFRMLQVAGIGDRLTGVHSVWCQFTRGTSAESCVRILRFAVSQVDGGPAVSIGQEFVSGGGDRWFYFYPSVALNNAGTAALAFDASRTNGYLGSIWAVKRRSEVTLSSAGWLTQGTCLRNTALAVTPIGPDYYRAGDYSGAAADPDGTTTWVAGERALRVPGIGCAWATRIARIAP
jgi:hypothetical protein